MKKNTSQTAIGVLIALGLYLLSSVTGSIINVLVMYAAGFDNWKQFTMSGNAAGIFVIFLIGVANHLFMAWVTVCAMTKYGKKHNCVDQGYFRIAAAAVLVFAAVILPVLLSSNSGWITYLTHCLGILLFGQARVKKLQTQGASSAPASDGANAAVQTAGQPMAAMQSCAAAPVQTVRSGAAESEGTGRAAYCHACGEKLPGNNRFCHKCGARIEEENGKLPG